MPKLIYTSNGEPYYVPDDELTAGNPLYPTTYPNNEGVTNGDTPKTSLPVAMPDDISDLPTFPVKQDLLQPKDRRTKEEKLAEMFGVVPGPEGPLGIVQSIESGLTAPGDVVKGNVEQQDVLGRAIDTAGLGVTGPLAMKPGTATLGSGMSRPTKFYRGENPGDVRRIKTGNENWDNYLFASSKPEDASMYGKTLTEYHANPDTKILYEGTKDFVNVAGKWRKGESLLDFSSRAASAAKDAGYDAVHFTRQGDVGTAIFNPNKFTKLTPVEHNPFLASDASNVGKVVAAAQHAPALFSTLEQSLAKVPMKSGTKEQWVNAFKRYGTSNEELQYGLGELPNGVINRELVEQAVKDNAVKLGEHWKGLSQDELTALVEKEAKRILKKDYPNLKETDQAYKDKWYDAYLIATENINKDVVPTKYSQYQMPGEKSNYREVLYTFPVEKTKQRISFDDWYKQTHIKDFNELTAGGQQIARNQYEKEGQNVINSSIYRSSHWDEPNVIVHGRVNDRIVDGKKSLHIEELQSDWHQAGRKQGYKAPAKQLQEWEKRYNEVASELHKAQKYYEGRPDPDGRNGGVTGPSLLDAIKQAEDFKTGKIKPDEGHVPYEQLPDKDKTSIDRMIVGWRKSYEIRYPEGIPKRSLKEIEKEYSEISDVWNKHHDALPDAPFKNTWDELALKKLIRHAVENGYDAISWTPGRAQSTNPSKLVDAIRVNKMDDGTYQVGVREKGKSNITKLDTDLSEAELERTIGKDLAEKAKKQNTGIEAGHTYEGIDLEVGGTKEFYDKILVDKANKLVKKFGSKVESKEINLGRKHIKTYENQPNREEIHQSIHYLPLTPALKEAALSRGFPMFSAGLPVISPIQHNPFVKMTPVEHDPFKENDNE